MKDKSFNISPEGGDVVFKENENVRKRSISTQSAATGASSLMKTEEVKLERKLTLLNGVTLIVGSIIGSGIFISPVGVLVNSGSAGLSIIIWAVCGLLSLMGALCYAELGTTFDSSGGDFTYIRTTFGSIPAFMYLWVTIIVAMPCQQAIVSITFADYASLPFFPEPDCPPSNELRLMLAAICLIVLSLINGFSVRWGTRVQDFFTFGKVIALILVIILGIIGLIEGTTTSFKNSFAPIPGYPVTALTIGQAMYGGLFAYGGWNSLNFLIEELKDPHRNLPRAIIIALPLVTTIYVLANIGYLAVLSPLEMILSDAVALTFGEKSLGNAADIMAVAVALSTFGAVNGVLMYSSRLCFAGARADNLPQVLSMIHVDRKTPLPALIFSCFVSSMYLFVSDIGTLLNYFNFVTWTSIGFSITGMLVMRYRMPELPRPVKVPLLLPVVFIAVALFLVIFGAIATPIDTLIGFAIAMSGLPVYFLGVYWTNKPKWLQRALDSMTVNGQRILLVAPQHTAKDK